MYLTIQQYAAKYSYTSRQNPWSRKCRLFAQGYHERRVTCFIQRQNSLNKAEYFHWCSAAHPTKYKFEFGIAFYCGYVIFIWLSWSHILPSYYMWIQSTRTLRQSQHGPNVIQINLRIYGTASDCRWLFSFFAGIRVSQIGVMILKSI